MFLVEDRERIARDLHDVVIQRLFAAGMGLQASLGANVKLEEKALATIDELDETINVIRETIFQLTQPDLSGEGSFGG
ncbi:MAG: histidine kinase dimerization/phosphoacceptor domain-containing protein [Acidimicrobiales bacterium]